MSDPQPIRKTMKRWEIPGDIRFVTFSCEQRLPLLAHPSIKDLFVDRLFAARAKHEFHLFAWVVMPEHTHLLMRPKRGTNLDAALASLKTSIGKRVIRRWQQLGAPILDKIAHSDGFRFWQRGGGFDRNVRDLSEFCRHVRYIHLNPVKRGLVAGPTDWRWSSIHWWLSPTDSHPPCNDPPGRPGEWSRWRGFM